MYLAALLPAPSFAVLPDKSRGTTLHSGKDLAVSILHYYRHHPDCSGAGRLSPPASLLAPLFAPPQRTGITRYRTPNLLLQIGECSDFPLSKSDCLTHLYYSMMYTEMHTSLEVFV